MLICKVMNCIFYSIWQMSSKSQSECLLKRIAPVSVSSKWVFPFFSLLFIMIGHSNSSEFFVIYFKSKWVVSIFNYSWLLLSPLLMIGRIIKKATKNYIQRLYNRFRSENDNRHTYILCIPCYFECTMYMFFFLL